MGVKMKMFGQMKAFLRRGLLKEVILTNYRELKIYFRYVRSRRRSLVPIKGDTIANSQTGGSKLSFSLRGNLTLEIWLFWNNEKISTDFQIREFFTKLN